MTMRTPFAYAAVAGTCLIIHNAVIIGGDFMGAPLWLGVLASFMTVATVGYLLHAMITFRQPLSAAGCLRYFIGMSANIPLAFGTTWIWNVLVGLPMALAAPIASACMLLINFIIGRWAIVAPASDRANAR